MDFRVLERGINSVGITDSANNKLQRVKRSIHVSFLWEVASQNAFP
jgi:hypothetical protein